MVDLNAVPLYHQWGCDGRHHGSGTPDCPRELHHHHDQFCDPPPIVRLLHFLTPARKMGISSSVWGSRG